MDKTIRLLQKWSYDGTEYPIGQLLTVDAKTATDLVEAKIAELCDEDEKRSVKAVEGETGAAGVTLEQVTEVVTAAVAKAAGKSGNARPVRIQTKDLIDDDPKRGYSRVGDFFEDIRLAGTPGASPSKRMDYCKAPPPVTKAVGTDEYTTVEDSIGGYLIPPEYRSDILTKGVEADFVRANGAQLLPLNSTMMVINAVTDTTRTVNLYGGIAVFLQKERAQMTSARGEFEQIEIKPTMLTGLAYLTDNQIHHVPSMGSFIGQQFRDAIVWKEMGLFMNGKGAGEPLGVLNAPATYSQAKETGQAAATIVTSNVLKMRSHMRPEEYSGAVWVASLSCMEQLNLLTIDVGTGGAPVALVRIAEDGIERILGRPLIYTEHAKAIGTVGDLTLVSWPNYLIGETTYTSVDTSIHIRFDYNETAFRYVKTIDGQPWWRTTLTLNNSWEVAPVVTLAARA